MRAVLTSAVALAATALVGSATASDSYPFRRTERREACTDYDRLKRPLFGDLHDHTNYSIDAFTFDVGVKPNEAYEFAKGNRIDIQGKNPDGSRRTAKLTRPLDFAAVTDHSEGFALARICQDPAAPGYDSPECTVLRAPPPFPARVKLLLLISYVGMVPPTSPLTCAEPGVYCDAAAVSIWDDIQRAAEQAYDRTSSCSFTTFVAYEWTPMPGSANMHRNVIFRNARVPTKPISYYDTESVDILDLAPRLWSALRAECLDENDGELTLDAGCDVMTIPHNMNLSAGLMFPDPADPRTEASFESVAEIMQHKGESECRFDKTFGSGVQTNDELCAFEQMPALTLLPVPGPYVTSIPPQLFAPRAFLRNVLKDGLALEQRDGVNPFKLGFIGSTDTHQGTPGNTFEKGWPGHVGNQDDTAVKRMSDGGVARTNPGGLAVVWAEENSRDAIFEALRRRETYGTSGTRPVVRFFGAWSGSGRGTFDADLCDRQSLVATGYRQGVPMGGDLQPKPPAGGEPRFVVSALQDPGFVDDDGMPHAGTTLQRIQIVKGWVDESGKTQERVYEARAVDANTDVADHDTCAPPAGAASLCTVWTDPDFNPREHAFYYARVVEEPSCRWSTYDCRALGIDPLAPQAECLGQALQASLAASTAAGAPTTFQDCCRIDPLIQERAWTSPIWYKPPS
jgi:Protein of unknown function (DUF3604)